MVAVATWLPLVLFVIGCIMATRILSQQNVFQRYEWYWMKVTGRLRIGLVGASGIAIVLAIYSTWRIGVCQILLSVEPLFLGLGVRRGGG